MIRTNKEPCLFLTYILSSQWFASIENHCHPIMSNGCLSKTIDHSIALKLYYRSGLIFLLSPFQVCLQGADGPVEPGPVPLVQHPPPADLGPKHPTTPHPLLHGHPRLRLPCHRRGLDRHPELHEREHQVPGQALSIHLNLLPL